jgi:hypothetical protein
MRPSESLFTGHSAAGRIVRVTRDTHESVGAQPFYVIAYETPGTTQHRYTPFEARARAIRDCFLADVTDPTRLARPGPVGAADPRPRKPSGRSAEGSTSPQGASRARGREPHPADHCRRVSTRIAAAP